MFDPFRLIGGMRWSNFIDIWWLNLLYIERRQDSDIETEIGGSWTIGWVATNERNNELIESIRNQSR